MANDQTDALPAEGLPDPTAKTDREQQPAAAEKTKRKADISATLAKMRRLSPYTVMLAIALAAILIAILCLFLEWASYGFDRSAEGAKQLVFALPISPADLLACIGIS